MRYQQALAAALFAGAFLAACRKEPANEQPRITILSPSDYATITVPDTLSVTVEASDDIGLGTVHVSLYDANGIPAGSGASASLSGTSATATLHVPVVSEQIASGVYRLRATVSDGSLSGWDSRNLQVVGVPLRLRAVYALVEVGPGTLALYRTDSTGQTTLATTWPMALGGAAVSSAAQRLFIAGGSTGNLLALEPDGLGTSWQLPNQSAIGIPWFTSVDLCADGRLYVGMDDGTVRGYTALNGTGGTVAGLQEQFRAERCAVQDGLLAVVQRHFVTGERRLGLFHSLSGAMQGSMPLDLVPTGLFAAGDGHMLVFGNRNGQGRVQDIGLEGGSAWEMYAWSSEITAVERIADHTWAVALADGSLHRFNTAGGGSVPLATTPVLHTMAFDEVNGILYGGTDGQVLSIHPGNGSTLGSISVGGAVLRLLPLYNR